MRLSLATLPPGRLIGASASDKTGIVHFCLGNFHRAHQAVNTALALAAEPRDWGILGVANRSRTVVYALERGRMPPQLALTVAGWICCTCPPAGFDSGPIASAMIEPKLDALRAATAGMSGVRAHVEAILRGGFFPDEIVAHDDFVARVTELVRLIVTDGVRVAAADALAS
jgi:mannitol-1-phosphate/altronate dehydrogenase